MIKQRNNNSAIVATAFAVVLCVFSAFAANKPGYNVKASEIVPRWSGAYVNEWTMDHDAALTAAKNENKWTLVLFSAMWWCPFCQPLEAKVLNTSAWQRFVGSKGGIYETVLDFPYRDGVSNWCWLYETNYVENAGMTMEQAYAEIDRRYAIQESYALAGSTPYNISTWDGSGTISYHKVGYPTIIMIRPDGTEAGRLSPSSVISLDEEAAQQFVMNAIEGLMAPEAAIGETEYLSLADAFAAANKGDTIRLLKTFNLSAPVTVSTSDLTLDFDGHSITLQIYSSNTQYNAFELTDGVSMKIIGGEGKLTGLVQVADGANLTIESGDFSFDPTHYLPEDRMAIADGNRWMVVESWGPHLPEISYEFVAGIEIEDLYFKPVDSSVKITAKSLPKGLSLKYNSKDKSYRIGGKPTTEQEIVSTFTAESKLYGKETRMVSFRIIFPKLEIIPVGDTNGCSVVGTGSYLPGKRVIMQAKSANKTKTVKKTVFGGWYADEACTQPLPGAWLNDKYTHEVTVEDAYSAARYYAKFINDDSEEAQKIEISTEQSDYLLPAGVDSEIKINVKSASRYTVKAENLPFGLKLLQQEDGSYIIGGQAKNPGELDKPVVLTATNFSNKSGEKFEFRIVVDNYRSDAFASLLDSYDMFIAGVHDSIVIEDAIGATVQNLPSGLKFERATGRIYGIAKKPGKSLVTFTKKVGSVQEKATARFIVYQGEGMDPEHPGVIFDGIAITPTLESDPAWKGEPLVLYAGVHQRFPLAVSGLDGDITKLSATGLPSGIKLVKDAILENKKIIGYNYSLEGVPDKVQAAKTIKITGSNSYKWTGSTAFDVEVVALPTWATGSFDGVVISDGVSVGSATLTISAAGAISGKATFAGVSKTIKAKSFDAFDKESNRFNVDVEFKTSNKDIVELPLQILSAKSGVGMASIGDIETLGLHLAQNVWQRKDLSAPVFPKSKQAISLVTDDGVTLKFNSNGKVAIAGKIEGDNGNLTAVSGNTQVLTGYYEEETGINANVVVYIAPKANLKAGFCQVYQLAVDVDEDNMVKSAEVINLPIE